jgi:hypothetical protein
MTQAFVDADIAFVARKLMEASELVPVMVTLVQGFAFQIKVDSTIDTPHLIQRIAVVMPGFGEVRLDGS